MLHSSVNPPGALGHRRALRSEAGWAVVAGSRPDDNLVTRVLQ